MILRRPYAFLIKNFKLIHLLFVFLCGYLMYRTNILHNFFEEANDVKILNGRELTNSLYNSWMYIVVFIIILLIITIIGLMSFKKKKTLLYYINLIFYIALGVFYYYSYTQVSIMEITAIDIRTIRFIYDLLGIVLVFQFFSMVTFAVRATGFDIKKFNFGQDIIDLQIGLEDKEEFEVNFDLDVNRVNKKVRKNLRFWKYTYVENRFLINLAICFVVALGLLFTVLYIDSNRRFLEQTPIQTTNFIVEVENSYITAYNYQTSTIISDKKFVVVKVKLQTLYEEKLQLQPAMFKLEIDDKTYYPTYDYRDEFVDMGTTYYDQKITNTSSAYIFIYAIDKNDTYKEATLNFYDGVDYGKSGNNNLIYRIKLEFENLDTTEFGKTYNLGTAVSIDNDFVKDGKFKITGYEINKRFSLTYNFCATTSQCFNSIEYLVPKTNSNIDKVLLKINGTWTMTNEVIGLVNLYDFLRMYGSISYTVGNKNVEQRLNLGRVIPLKTKENDVFYLEIPEQVTGSQTISLIIRVRNTTFKYVIKK